MAFIDLLDFCNIYAINVSSKRHRSNLRFWQQLKDIAKNQVLASVVDLWSSQTYMPTIGITMHYIDTSFIPKHFTLAFKMAPHPHTAVNAKKYVKVLLDYKINQQISFQILVMVLQTTNSIKQLL